MEDISIFDSASSLDSLLDAVAAGRDVVITREGKAVARLVPSTAADDVRQTIEAFRTLRTGIAARGEAFPASELRDLRGDGQR